MAFANWSSNPSNNSLVDGITWSNGMLPSQIDDSGRQMMADLAAWRDAPFFPNGLTTGGSFSTNAVLRVGTDSGKGHLRLTPGSTTGSGIAEFYNPSGTRVGYIYQPTTGLGANTLLFGKDDGTGFTFAGGPLNVQSSITATGNISRDAQFYMGFSADPFLAFDNTDFLGYTRGTNKWAFSIGGNVTLEISPSAVNSNAPLQQAGSQVWHASNLNAAAIGSILGYTPANAGGQTFTGPIRRDAQFYMDFIAGSPALAFDSGDYLAYDRGANKLFLFIGGNAVASVDSGGNLRVTGNVTGLTTP